MAASPALPRPYMPPITCGCTRTLVGRKLEKAGGHIPHREWPLGRDVEIGAILSNIGNGGVRPDGSMRDMRHMIARIQTNRALGKRGIHAFIAPKDQIDRLHRARLGGAHSASSSRTAVNACSSRSATTPTKSPSFTILITPGI